MQRTCVNLPTLYRKVQSVGRWEINVGSSAVDNSPKLEMGHQEQDGQISYKIHSEILFSSENE